MALKNNSFFTERRKQILAAVVDKHVRTAQPVGSEALVTEYSLKISSATVRLEFIALERMGLVFQPHTSSGRVPSDTGYRTFVDKVLTKHPLQPRRIHFWEKNLAKYHYGEIRELLQASCTLLSQVSRYASWAILPRKDTEIVHGIHIAPLTDRRVVVMIWSHRLVNKMFRLLESFENYHWQRATNWVNAKFCGMSLSQIAELSWSQLASPDVENDPIFKVAFNLVRQLVSHVLQPEIWLEGLAKILSEPEFQQPQRAQCLISFWGTPQKLASLCQIHANRCLPLTYKAWVSIGAENQLAKLDDCSLVGAPFFLEGNLIGFIGVLGPKRMRYSETIPIVENFAPLLSKALMNLLS